MNLLPRPLILLFIGALLTTASFCQAQVSSTWQPTSGSTDWQAAENWTNGVPNAPGDSAVINATVSQAEMPVISSPISLGRLAFDGRPMATLSGAATLTLDNPGETGALIILPSGARTATEVDMTVPVAIADGQETLVYLAQGNTLNLHSPIISSGGDLAISSLGSGQVHLGGDSPAWGGNLTVRQGVVTIESEASLGSSLGYTRVDDNGVLQLRNDVLIANEILQLDGGTIQSSPSGSPVPTIAGEVQLLSTGTIENVLTNGYTLLQGTLTGPGGVTYGRGRYEVDASGSYLGATTIDSTSMIVRSATAFGSPDEGTTLLGSTDLFVQQSNSEPFILQGGRLFVTESAAAVGPVLLSGGELVLQGSGDYGGAIVVEGPGQMGVVSGRRTITSGVTGTGTLTLNGVSVSGQPIAHDGDLVLEGGELSSPNTFTGDTYVTGYTTVNHAGALGASTSRVRVESGGVLNLNAAAPQQLEVFGRLAVSTPGVTLNRDILLGNALYLPGAASIAGVGVFDGKVVMAQSSANGPSIRGGVFNGAIEGGGQRLPLHVDDPIYLNGENTYVGWTAIAGDDAVYANSPTALGETAQGTQVSVGQLVLNASVNEAITAVSQGRVVVNVQQPRLPRLIDSRDQLPRRIAAVEVNHTGVYDELVDVAAGSFEVNRDLTVAEVNVRQEGRLSVGNGAELSVLDGEITLSNGTIEGQIAVVDRIRKVSGHEGRLGELPGFGGEIVVEKGRLVITSAQSFGDSSRATHITGRDASLVLWVDQPQVVTENIYLHNTQGDYASPGLMVFGSFNGESEIEMRGRLDLGDVGSSIGKPGSGYSRVDFFGAITGGSLAVEGDDFTAEIHTAESTFNGDADVYSGRLQLSAKGQLHTPSRIVVHEAPGYRNGVFAIDQRSGTIINDRVGDAIPIDARGGSLEFQGEVTEDLGALSFLEGDSLIEMTANSTDAAPKRVTFASLHRERGAIAQARFGTNSGVMFDEEPATVGGIIPWMSVYSNADVGFAMPTPNGLAPHTTFGGTINSADATSNVRIASAVMTVPSQAVNSIVGTSNSGTLDLGGGQLVVESGGVLRMSSISNGRLTAGAAGGHELILLTPMEVSADIVDNGANPVAVTAQGSFSGVNTYTGGTFVPEGGLTFQNESSFPQGTPMTISGGEVRINYKSPNPQRLTHLAISEGGSLQAQSFGQDLILEFDTLTIDEGNVSAREFVGSGEIVKTGAGDALVSLTDARNFNGAIRVESGMLSASSTLGWGEGTFFEVNGGTLRIDRGDAPIRLDGADLSLGTRLATSGLEIASDIEVRGDSRIVRTGLAPGAAVLDGALWGDGSLTFSGQDLHGKPPTTVLAGSSPDFLGDVQIDSVEVVLTRVDALGTAPISVGTEGRLKLVSRAAGANRFLNPVTLQDGELLGFTQGDTFQEVAGDLRVQGDSRIDIVDVTGATHLADGSRLSITGSGPTRLLGPIHVGGAAEIAYGALADPSIIPPDESPAQLLGEIVSDATDSVLNLADWGAYEALFDFSLRANEGQHLTLLKDSAPLDIMVSGPGKRVTGGGVIRNDITVADRATVAPGASPGILTIEGELTLDAGAVLEIELAGTTPGNQHDLLLVGQQLEILEAELQVTLTDGFLPSFDDQLVIAAADQLVGRFSNPGGLVRMEGYRALIQYTDTEVRLGEFVRIPEPTAAWLAAGCAVMVVRRGRRGRCL